MKAETNFSISKQVILETNTQENDFSPEKKKSQNFQTPLHQDEEVHPIFGPKIKYEVDENASLYTCFLSTCNMKEKMKFMRKVYIINLILISFPLVFSLLAFSIKVERFINDNQWIFWLDLSFVVLTAIPLLIFPSLSKLYIWNYVFSIFLAFTVGILFLWTTTLVGNSLAAICACNLIICLTLLYFTYIYQEEEYPNFELISSTLSAAILFYLFAGLFSQISLNDLTISLSVSCLYSGFLILDTYIILGVNSKKYNLEDYVLVAMTLYTDVVMLIFFLISKIFEKEEKKEKSAS